MRPRKILAVDDRIARLKAGSQIVAVNPDGSDPSTLGPGSSPSYSPNGARIAFSRITVSSVSEEGDIYTMKADGTG